MDRRSKLIQRFFTGVFFLLFSIIQGLSQGCCSGGSGSPIVGDASAGVLLKDQMEFSLSYQYFQSNHFFSEGKETDALFDNLYNNYLFFRTDYGISKRVTLSIGSGYFINKSLVELGNTKTISADGFGDLLVFPRFNVYQKSSVLKRTEATLGVGLKLPVGKHDDAYLVFSSPVTGDIYSYAPPTVQTTNGSQDLMFYGFLFRDYQIRKLRFFTTILYIKKSYNSLGQRFGDYASIGFFASKSITNALGITVQLRGELIGKMRAAEGVDLLAQYNIDQNSTGSKKLFFVPQISYSYKKFSFFITSEIPIYQYLEGTQIGSQYQFTSGFAYRFLTRKAPVLEGPKE